MVRFIVAPTWISGFVRVETPSDRRGAVITAKRELRARMKKRRADLYAADPHAGAELAARRPIAPIPKCAALYHPMGTEIDVLPLARALRDAGATIAFPRVEDGAMRFLVHDVDGPWIRDACGAPAPPRDAEEASPDLVVAPLLAFDAAGRRLGYGGGWYDRTLNRLWTDNPNAVVLGAGFSGQKVDYVPSEPHDFNLRGVLTELGAVRTAS